MGASSRSRAPRRAHGSRRAPVATLARFAVAGARGDVRAMRRALRGARGLRRRMLEETALMLMLYAGYPAALEALRALNDVRPGRPRRSREGGPRAWRRRGTALSRAIYGPVHARLLRAVRALHPDLAVWMVEQGYGRVLARPGLPVAARELITVAVLAATGRERQLVSHLIGARRVGVAVAPLAAALRIGRTRAASPAVARRAWKAAFGAAVDRPGSAP